MRSMEPLSRKLFGSKSLATCAAIFLSLGLAFSAHAEREYPLIIGVDYIRKSESSIEHVYLPVVTYRSTFEEVQRWDEEAWTMWSSRMHLLSEWYQVFLYNKGEPLGKIQIQSVEGRSFHCNTLTAGVAEAAPPDADAEASIGSSTFSFDPLHGKQEFESRHYLAFSGKMDRLAALGSVKVESDAGVIPFADISESFSADAEGLLKTDAQLDRAGEFTVQFNDTRIALVQSYWETTRKDQWGAPEATLNMVHWRNLADEAGRWQLLANSTGSPSGWGVGLAFLDAFALADGKLILIFETSGYESVGYRLYEISGEKVEPKQVFDQILYGC